MPRSTAMPGIQVQGGTERRCRAAGRQGGGRGEHRALGGRQWSYQAGCTGILRKIGCAYILKELAGGKC
ncbi:hypothetical protein V3F56_03880 [Moorellaceae bacterium AZ2]